jgi:hypothetical protein
VPHLLTENSANYPGRISDQAETRGYQDISTVGSAEAGPGALTQIPPNRNTERARIATKPL